MILPTHVLKIHN